MPDLRHAVALVDREAGELRRTRRSSSAETLSPPSGRPQRGEVVAVARRGRGPGRSAPPGASTAPSAAARAAAAAARGRRWSGRRRPGAPTDSVAQRPQERRRCATSTSRGGTTSSRASSSSAAAALAIIQPQRLAVWVTPLAGPVLPDVKKITAGAPGRRAASGSGSAESAPRAMRLNRARRRPRRPSRTITPHGSSPARRLAARSSTRSTCASSARAPLTSRA